MAAKSLPDVAYLRECFDYDPATGVLTWKARPLAHFNSEHDQRVWCARLSNMTAGGIGVNGYRYVSVQNRRYGVHRIIWAIQTGAWPGGQIDHINHDRADNTWHNLRLATAQQNQRNRKKWLSSVLPKGAVRTKNGKFQSSITVDGRVIHLGTFETAAEAHAAYCMVASQHYGDFFFAGDTKCS